RRALLLSEVIGAFANVTTDYQPLMDVISQRVAELVGDICSLLLLSEDGQSLELAATHARDPDMLALVRATYAGEPLAVLPAHQRILDTGEPMFSPRVTPERVRATSSEKTAELTERIG